MVGYKCGSGWESFWGKIICRLLLRKDNYDSKFLISFLLSRVDKLQIQRIFLLLFKEYYHYFSKELNILNTNEKCMDSQRNEYGTGDEKILGSWRVAIIFHISTTNRTIVLKIIQKQYKLTKLLSSNKPMTKS